MRSSLWHLRCGEADVDVALTDDALDCHCVEVRAGGAVWRRLYEPSFLDGVFALAERAVSQAIEADERIADAAASGIEGGKYRVSLRS